MSGFCALYAMSGEPCNRELLTRMSQSVSARGDTTGVWSEGPIGLAMTIWRQHQISPLETPPYFWGAGEYRVAADVRLSQRETLLQTLQKNRMLLKDTSDTALLVVDAMNHSAHLLLSILPINLSCSQSATDLGYPVFTEGA